MKRLKKQENEKGMKGNGRLFESIPQDVHDRVYKDLQRMQAAYPTYRDDQLLMYLLCELDESTAPGDGGAK